MLLSDSSIHRDVGMLPLPDKSEHYWMIGHKQKPRAVDKIATQPVGNCVVQ